MPREGPPSLAVFAYLFDTSRSCSHRIARPDDMHGKRDKSRPNPSLSAPAVLCDRADIYATFDKSSPRAPPYFNPTNERHRIYPLRGSLHLNILSLRILSQEGKNQGRPPVCSSDLPPNRDEQVLKGLAPGLDLEHGLVKLSPHVHSAMQTRQPRSRPTSDTRNSAKGKS